MQEGLKEVARWVVFFIASWILTTIASQINLVPEFHTYNVWVFTFSIPVRAAWQFGITFALRYLDKYKFTESKQNIENKAVDTAEKPKGVLPF